MTETQKVMLDVAEVLSEVEEVANAIISICKRQKEEELVQEDWDVVNGVINS